LYFYVTIYTSVGGGYLFYYHSEERKQIPETKLIRYLNVLKIIQNSNYLHTKVTEEIRVLVG
jgi:hypothetical protein